MLAVCSLYTYEGIIIDVNADQIDQVENLTYIGVYFVLKLDWKILHRVE